jgi:Carboxypeptidase regulatory-like domain
MRAKAATVAVVIAVVSACSATAPATTNGTLTGQVKVYGGPPTATGQALNGGPGPGWHVIVRSRSQEVATTTSDSSGHFKFKLAPGTYTLICSIPQKVEVRSGQQTTVACIATVP